jgi:glutaminyl-peptide cyclotransferase
MPRALNYVALTLLAALICFILTYNLWSTPGQNTPKPEEKQTMDWDAKVDPVAFDAKRAMGFLEAVCKIGPRMSGTDGMKKQQELMEKHFKELGGKITWQKFSAQQKSLRKPTEMANMIVSWKPEEKRRIILCSHYDTRPIADQDPDENNHLTPIVSANDGGSGVALLMELAHQMNKLPLKVGVDFVFFDGEEYVFDGHNDKYFFGSEHFGAEYAKTRKDTGVEYVAAILLDMIAGKDLNLPVEQNSEWSAPKLVRDVYRVARELKAPAFKVDEKSKYRIEDDHLALNQNKIPAIDLIDFDYKHWHCVTDLPENCSGDNMAQVAKVVSVWMQRVK